MRAGAITTAPLPYLQSQQNNETHLYGTGRESFTSQNINNNISSVAQLA